MASVKTMKWYALAVNSGQEKRIRQRIFDRLEKAKIELRGITIVCPEEEVVLEKEGEKVRKKRMSMPGYLLIHGSRIPEETIIEMNRVAGVLGFLGNGEQPTHLKDAEVEKILGANGLPAKEGGNKMFNAEDEITVIEGPLSDFSGRIISVSETEAQVEVEIFGRSTKASIPLRSLRKN